MPFRGQNSLNFLVSRLACKKTFQHARKLSRLSEKFPDCPETFQTVWIVFTLSGNFPGCLKNESKDIRGNSVGTCKNFLEDNDCRRRCLTYSLFRGGLNTNTNISFQAVRLILLVWVVAAILSSGPFWGWNAYVAEVISSSPSLLSSSSSSPPSSPLWTFLGQKCLRCRSDFSWLWVLLQIHYSIHSSLTYIYSSSTYLWYDMIC